MPTIAEVPLQLVEQRESKKFRLLNVEDPPCFVYRGIIEDERGPVAVWRLKREGFKTLVVRTRKDLQKIPTKIFDRIAEWQCSS